MNHCYLFENILLRHCSECREQSVQHFKFASGPGRTDKSPAVIWLFYNYCYACGMTCEEALVSTHNVDGTLFEP